MASEQNSQSLTSPYPIPADRLDQIANDACDSTFRTASSYDHSQTSSWNTSIINTILQSLISATSTPTAPPAYKFAVTSTIIQHTSPPPPRHPTADDFPRPPSSIAGASDATTLGGADDEHAAVASTVSDEPAGKMGSVAKTSVPARRGMHCATGAFWDRKRDGMWSFKYEGETRGFDVVISVVWISI